LQIGETPTDTMLVPKYPVRLDVPIVESCLRCARSGKHPKLAGRPALVMGGRADVRFSIDAGGELFLYSKSDGVIRAVVEAIGFLTLRPAEW
jgi:hypothetical protein